MVIAEITVDGIPLGEGFGIDIGREEQQSPVYEHIGLTKFVASPPPLAVWMTKRDQCGVYHRVRHLRGSRVIAKSEGSTIEFYEGLLKVTKRMENES